MKRVSILAKIVTGIAIGSAAFTSLPASAATHKPTDVYATFYDQGDTPLRYGTANSYGKLHIENGHKSQITKAGGWDNVILDISHTFHDGKCGKPNNGKITCNVSGGLHGGFKAMRVVYTESASGMPDGRPKGIITAFYP